MAYDFLKGVKVIDLTTNGAGPGTTRVLGDWGADVVKVESLEGDMARWTDLSMGFECNNGTNPGYELFNANKRALSINIKTEKGREILDKLISEADVFVSSNRMRALKKNGLDYETMSAKYPHIIWAHISGYGIDGPNGNDPGYDTVSYWSKSGMLADFVERGNDILVPPVGVADLMLGPVLAGGIAAALYRQKQTGKGEKVMCSLYGLAVWSLGYMSLSTQAGSIEYPKSRRSSPPLLNSYKCKDGEWIVLTNFDWDRYFPLLCRLFGAEELIGDPRFANEILGRKNNAPVIDAFEKGMLQKTSLEWAQIFQENDVAFSIVNHIKNVATDEQAIANGYVYPVEGRTKDRRTYMLSAPPVHFKDSMPPEHKNAPLMGEHTDEVLTQAGFSSEEIARWREEKIIL